jgi:hypothetical protein
MNRRKAIQRASLMLGGLLAAPIWAGAMGKVLNTGQSVAVSDEQELLLADLADVIIPTTTTPGAKAAGADKFIVRVMRDCYPKADQEKFYGGLAQLDQDCKTDYSKNFVRLSDSDKIAAVKKLTTTNPAFFLRMKELTVTGYFTSKIGATEALAYLPIPGKLIGCMPLEKNQKTWASN